jgi:hypothetical protein
LTFGVCALAAHPGNACSIQILKKRSEVRAVEFTFKYVLAVLFSIGVCRRLKLFYNRGGLFETIH